MLKEEDFLNRKPIVWYRRVVISALIVGVVFILLLFGYAAFSMAP